MKKELRNLVVRTAQEVVELSLKAVFKTRGIDYPKEHDTGEIFPQVVRDKGIKLNKKSLREIGDVSKWLTEERAPVFYYEEKWC